MGNPVAGYRADFEQLTSRGVGSVPAAISGTCFAEERGNSILHQTYFNFAAMPVTVANVTGASFGNKKVYDFPKGRILVLGHTNYFTRIDWSAEGIAAGGSGDYSFGSTASADATLAGTDIDMLASTAMLDPFVAGVGRSNALGILAASAQIDGSTTALDMYLNVIIDDADVADADSDIVLFTGWSLLSWINLGASPL